MRLSIVRITGLVAAACLAAFGGGISASVASPARTTLSTAPVAGVVYASVQIGDRTFIAGNFSAVGGLPRQNAAAILANGEVDPTWDPSPNATVRALATSEDGTTVYLGGAFTAVGPTTQRNLAAVTSSTGAVRSTFRTGASYTVDALATFQDTLYVGGRFDRIGGVAVPRLAAVDAATGAVDQAFAPRPNAKVSALTVSSDGSKVYAGGAFTTISGVARPGIAEIDGNSGNATSFAPTDGGVALAVALSDDDSHLFASTTNNRTWAYDPATSSSPQYRVRTGGDVQAIAVGTNEVYIGGHFNGLPEFKVSRPRIASFRISDGTPTPWRVVLDSFWGVWTFTATPDYLAVGGAFEHVNGVERPGFARFPGSP